MPELQQPGQERPGFLHDLRCRAQGPAARRPGTSGRPDDNRPRGGRPRGGRPRGGRPRGGRPRGASLFLPWFGVLGFTVSGIGLHGYLAISLIAAVAVIGYLVLRAGWETLPFRLPVAHVPLLLIGTGVQLLFVLIAFAFRPSGTSWEFGAYLGLLAALVACGVVAAPAISSMQAARQR